MELDAGQLEAIDRLKNGSILVGKVGSGKSRTALAYFFIKECKGSLRINDKGEYSPMAKPKDLYIITTAKKRDEKEWEREFIPFCLYPVENAPMKITIDSWQNLPKHVNAMNSFFIFDEQRLVSYGKWTKSFLRISKNNKWILLSATPADKWEDLAPIFIANGFYPNISDFRNRHCVYSRYTKWPQIIRYINVARLRKLREEIYVDLPYSNDRVKHNENIVVQYDKDLYKRILVNRWDPFKNEPVQNVSQLCQLLRKVTNIDQTRIEAVKNLIMVHPKVIIFYNYDYELEILRQIAKDLSIEKAEWNGHIHQPVPNSNVWIYLVQYTAGAEGWNCTTCNTIIFYSQNYSYKTMIQAAGRIDRRNTPFKDLYYYHIRSSSSLDMAITRSLKNKKKFNESKFIDSGIREKNTPYNRER